MEDKEQSKTKSKIRHIVSSILRWIFGIVLILLGIGLLFSAADPGDPAVFGVIFIFIGVLFLPPMTRFVERKWGVSFSDGLHELKEKVKPAMKSVKKTTKFISQNTIEETKCTCISCNNIWFYGKQDKQEQRANKMHNTGKSLLACGTCGTPLGCLFWLMPEKKIVDLGKCPKCGSMAVKKEIVIHYV